MEQVADETWAPGYYQGLFLAPRESMTSYRKTSCNYINGSKLYNIIFVYHLIRPMLIQNIHIVPLAGELAQYFNGNISYNLLNK